MGTVRIEGRAFEMPDEQAREFAEAIAYLQRKGGWISPNPDTLIAINPTTQVEVDVPGAFTDYPTPADIIAKSTRPRRASVLL